MSGAAAGSGSASGGAPRRRLSQAETIRRQQAIVRARELERLTWAETAARVGMGEKEARQSYRRYLAEIAPLLLAAPAEEVEAGLLRDLDEARQRLFQLAACAEHESAEVGALREVLKSIQVEFEVRRALGLMPKPVANVELRSLACDLLEVLDRHGVAAEVLDEVEQVFRRRMERSDSDGWAVGSG